MGHSCHWIGPTELSPSPQAKLRDVAPSLILYTERSHYLLSSTALLHRHPCFQMSNWWGWRGEWGARQETCGTGGSPAHCWTVTSDPLPSRFWSLYSSLSPSLGHCVPFSAAVAFREHKPCASHPAPLWPSSHWPCAEPTPPTRNAVQGGNRAGPSVLSTAPVIASGTQPSSRQMTAKWMNKWINSQSPNLLCQHP